VGIVRAGQRVRQSEYEAQSWRGENGVYELLETLNLSAQHPLTRLPNSMKGAIFIEPEHFINLFEYDGWASRRILEALAAPPAANLDRCLDLLSHLLRSQNVWIDRIEENNGAHLALWERDSLAACAERCDRNNRNWLRLLSSCAPGDFNTLVTYTTQRGETYTSEMREILTHVVNHGTHHRAQIALLLREAGIAPPPTDYIIYTRSSEVKG
jgi:uncharacterized damage-inducible protein DinB